MEARLQKWGNSLGIRIPNNLLKDLNLKLNDTIKLEKEDDKIIMTKSTKPIISLAERFKKYNGPNLAKDFVWDNPKGGEIW